MLSLTLLTDNEEDGGAVVIIVFVDVVGGSLSLQLSSLALLFLLLSSLEGIFLIIKLLLLSKMMVPWAAAAVFIEGLFCTDDDVDEVSLWFDVVAFTTLLFIIVICDCIGLVLLVVWFICVGESVDD